MKVFCVIPAWNEEQNIGEVLEKLGAFVDEIVVVDDCSRDQTGLVAKKYGATVLRHPINRGQGAALQTGNSYALKNGADIIFRSRFLGKKANLPFFKKMLSCLWQK